MRRRRRTALLTALLATSFGSSSCTVFRHMYLAEGPSLVSYRDRQLVRAFEGGVGFTLDSMPTMAFGISVTGVNDPDHSPSFQPRCYTNVGGTRQQTGCYPTISGSSVALNAQKRWLPSRTVHPLVSVEYGRVRTDGFYRAQTGYQSDTSRASAFVALRGGGELNIARWLHLIASAGYRQVFHPTVGDGPIAQSGLTLTSLVVVGKPYR